MNQQFNGQWIELERLAKDSSLMDLISLFKHDSKRSQNLSFTVADIYIDFSKNWISQEILTNLITLSKHADLQAKINAMFEGKAINISENKSATHTAQRKRHCSSQVLNDRTKMIAVAENYMSGKWRSAFAKKIQTVVNIGIGGSYLGPKLAVEALSELQTNNDIKILFFPSVDSSALTSILQKIDLTTTLFCIGSKSLGTIESKKNAQTIMDLLCNIKGYKPNSDNQSFVVATANFEKAAELNIPESHVMPFDHATGGRFSVWSSIGFPVLMAIGKVRFLEFLAGAEKIDSHFQNTKHEKNIPVLMGLLSIWYRNFMKLPAYAVIPYDVRLKNLPAWLQQLMMESNGKLADVNGDHVNHSTSPWLFGDHGQLSQHAFFQAFHQGKDILPIDFIGVIEENDSNQDFLLVNMLAQSSALLNGDDDEKEMYNCPGNRPSTTFLVNGLTASTLGQILALYEHMVFVQSVIWNINCFDQPGVELGKKLARNIVGHMDQGTLAEMNLDQSTKILLSRVMNKN